MTVVAHGIDIVAVSRIRHVLERHGDRFLERCFTGNERDYAISRHDPAIHLAARFAAKEAVGKALGTGVGDGVCWTDISVERSTSGQPLVRLAGRAERVADSLGIDAWHLSLSHTDDTAMASVIAENSR